MFKALLQHFLNSNWLMKLVLIWAWISAIIMVFALFSPYYQAIMMSVAE